MILLEDANNERYYVNPQLVVYVKERSTPEKKMWKIMMVHGEALMTSNEQAACDIIAAIKRK